MPIHLTTPEDLANLVTREEFETATTALVTTDAQLVERLDTQAAMIVEVDERVGAASADANSARLAAEAVDARVSAQVLSVANVFSAQSDRIDAAQNTASSAGAQASTAASAASAASAAATSATSTANTAAGAAASANSRLDLAVPRVTDLETGLAALASRVTTVEQGGGGGAIVGPRYTVITDPTKVAQGIAAWLADRNGAFPRSHLVFDFIGTANLTSALLPSNTGQLQGIRWFGKSKRGTQLAWANTTVPMLSSFGQLRNYHFSDFTLTSTATVASPAKGWFLFSDVTNSNQDGTFEKVEFQGPWDYGIRLTGDADANLNSEITFDRCACGNGSSFATGLFVSGDDASTGLPVDAQEDQFLNFAFLGCKFEGSHGRYIVLNKGGALAVDSAGGSWLHTGQSGTPTRGSTGEMIHIPTGSHFNSTMVADIRNTRAELRFAGSCLADIGWGSGGRVEISSCMTDAYSHVLKTEEVSIRGGARVKWNGGRLGGWVGMYGTTAGRAVFDGPALATGFDTSAPGALTSTTHLVRRESASAGVMEWRL